MLHALGRALQGILNRALALDPAAGARLRTLSGRSVELTWSTADIGLRLGVEDGAVTVGPRQGQGSADLGVSGSLAGLLSLAGLARGAAGPAQRVDVSGDAQLAREIEKLVRDASPDLEAALADRLGNVAGPVMARTLLGAWSWARESAASLREDVAEYLVEESGDVIGEVDLAAFNRDVDNLRDRVERLDQRIAQVRRANAQQ
ncbi:MAG: SCP2 sterol-binding domain-containing protein [Lysobacterales bacterium]